MHETTAKNVIIREAKSAEDYTHAKALMIEYRDRALAEDYTIAGSGLNKELEAFPGPYGGEGGYVLLAVHNEIPCGCLAIRPLINSGEIIGAGEIVRMYVKPEMRGNKIAQKLMDATLIKAQQMGYTELYLDSLDKFTSAHKLYKKSGFTYCKPYSTDITPAMQKRMVFMQRKMA